MSAQRSMVRPAPAARRQRGFAYIAAVVFLVVIAGIAMVLLRLTDTQQATVNQALLGARANLTARAGIEWAFNNLRNRCSQTGAVNTLNDFSHASGFRVTVNCSFRPFEEGEAQAGGSVRKRIYRIEATACNGAATSCPDNNSVGSADYIERARVATVCELDAAGGGFCDG